MRLQRKTTEAARPVGLREVVGVIVGPMERVSYIAVKVISSIVVEDRTKRATLQPLPAGGVMSVSMANLLTYGRAERRAWSDESAGALRVEFLSRWGVSPSV